MLPERVHKALIQDVYQNKTTCHIVNDSTALIAREKAVIKEGTRKERKLAANRRHYSEKSGKTLNRGASPSIKDNLVLCLGTCLESPTSKVVPKISVKEILRGCHVIKTRKRVVVKFLISLWWKHYLRERIRCAIPDFL